MIVIIVLLFLIFIIRPNVIAKFKRKKVEDEEVPFQKLAAPEQQDDEEEVETESIKSFCLSKSVIETAV